MSEFINHQNIFRKDESSNTTIIDIEISSLTAVDSFDALAVHSALSFALNTVVDDGQIGDYGIDTSASIHIGEPATGKVQRSM